MHVITTSELYTLDRDFATQLKIFVRSHNLFTFIGNKDHKCKKTTQSITVDKIK